MVSIPSELSLACMPSFVPKTINHFLREISTIDSLPERLLRIDDYVSRLEDEMRKIDAFKRELPLCMLLVNDAIVALKEESAQCRKSRIEPVLEEFIPLKKNSDGGGDRLEIRKDRDSREKMNWMSSAALWHGENHFTTTNNKRRSSESDLKMTTEEAENSTITNDLLVPCKTSRNIGTPLMPFKRYSGFPSTEARKEEDKDFPKIPGLSLATPGFKNPREDIIIGCFNTKAVSSSTSSSSSLQTGAHHHQQQQTTTSRKQRRCWSPELHKRFINALQQLGGAQVATPKQIRELMQVDGLTNDEVKSHLQKYRLHTRRLPANQSVVLGNLFLGQEQCGESAKQSSSQSGSPQDPLHHGDSMEEEEEGDD